MRPNQEVFSGAYDAVLTIPFRKVQRASVEEEEDGEMLFKTTGIDIAHREGDGKPQITRYPAILSTEHFLLHSD